METSEDLRNIPLEIEKSEFFRKRDGRESAISPFRQIYGFVFVSGIVVLSLLGAFFAHNAFIAKDKGTEKSITAYQNFMRAEVALKSFDFKKAGEDFALAYSNLASAESSINEVGNLTVSIAENLPFDSRADSSISLLRAAKHIAKAGEIASSALARSALGGALSGDSFFAMIAGEAGGGRGYTPSDFNVLASSLSSAESELMSAEAHMQNVRASDFPEELQLSISELSRKIPVLLDIIQSARDFSGVSAFLFGVDAPRRYLIIFQNSSELRPAGGFAGSYAIIEVDKGKLKDIFVDGIYSADGQLTVNVVPPKPFQHITTAWSTHDANWFLDFPTSAKKVAWFYEKTGGGKVDGVLTLNVEVVERLLELTGPILLMEYDLALDSKNFRDEIQYEVEVAYDKAANRPKQVLSDFTPMFLDRLFEASYEKKEEIVSALLRALEEKYIMFYSDDYAAQNFFENQGWAGSINEEPETDFLSVVHSNIGGYKTDKFMEDKISYEAEIQEDGSIVGHLIIKRVHAGGESKYWWYNRSNIDYLKIYVEKGAEILSYSGGERRKVGNPADYEALKFTKDEDILAIESSLKELGPIDIFNESGKTVFGTWLVTKPKKTSVFEVRYKLPYRVEFKNGVGKYNLYLQKQPGTEARADVKVNPPSNFAVIWDNAETKGLKNSFDLATDKVIGYIFKNKK
jgi:hypothetical protein